jgi:hypothetical protein
MLAVIRLYEHVAATVAGSVIAARDQIEALLQGVPGARGSLLIRTRDGIALVALGTDEWCLAECGRRFRGWADAHVPDFRSAAEAAIWVGEVVGSMAALSTASGPAEG